MKVILLTELKGRGGEGDIIDVAPGFFNNYLGPQKMAVLATAGNLKQLEQRQGNIAKREEKRLAEAQELKAALEAKAIHVVAKVGEEGILFGSVTAQMIAAAISSELEIEIDKRRIDAKHAIKTAGEHEVTVSLYRDIKAVVKIFVGESFAEETVEEAPAAEAVETEAAAE